MKSGSINRSFEKLMGQQGLGTINENGQLFLDLCAFNRMVIGGRKLQHRNNKRQLEFRPSVRLKIR